MFNFTFFLAFKIAPSTWGMYYICYLHDSVIYPIIYSVVISIMVFLFIIWETHVGDKRDNIGKKEFNHHPLLEIIWTFVPAVLLLIIAIPSFTYLFQIERLGNPTITVKVMRHQWYIEVINQLILTIMYYPNLIIIYRNLI